MVHFKILEKNLDKLIDICSIYESVDIFKKREFVSMVFDCNLYYKEGMYRTPTMMRVLSRNSLIMKKKGLLNFEEKGVIDKSPLQWSRGESNSRPNKQLKRFLRVYSLIEFSSLCTARNSHTTLIFLVVKTVPKLNCF